MLTYFSQLFIGRHIKNKNPLTLAVWGFYLNLITSVSRMLTFIIR